jgi:hypothetical protein
MRRSPHLMGPSWAPLCTRTGINLFHLDVVAVDSTWNVVIKSDVEQRKRTEEEDTLTRSDMILMERK